MALMHPAPESTEDYQQVRKKWLEKRPDDTERRKTISASAAYKQGDALAITAYYRIHFQPALARREHIETIIARLRAIPKAHMFTWKDCGHFSYLERPAVVREQMDVFFRAK